MKYIITILIAAFLFSISDSFAQTEIVRKNLKMVANGKIDDVKRRLPDLLVEYPGDPGIQLLHGVVLDDAFKAIDIYKKIIKDHPDCEWADDAYWRIIQFYSVLGDTTQSRLHLQKFRQRYPDSEFLVPASDVVRSSVGLARMGRMKQPATSHTLHGDLTAPKKVSEDQLIKADNLIKEPEANTTPPPTKEAKTEEIKNEQPKPSQSGTYGLQVGIYSTKDRALAEMNKYLRQRMRTEVLEKVVDGEVLYAVVIGNYSSKQSAEGARQIVEQQCGCKPIVFEKP